MRVFQSTVPLFGKYFPLLGIVAYFLGNPVPVKPGFWRNLQLPKKIKLMKEIHQNLKRTNRIIVIAAIILAVLIIILLTIIPVSYTHLTLPTKRIV